MDYILADKLKKSGYPQQIVHGKLMVGGDGQNVVYIPTLTELLKKLPELCGLIKEEDTWRLYVNNVLNENTISKEPDEACAKLYLELNKTLL